MSSSITAVPGIRVGHFTDRVGLTGCTVVLCPEGTVGSGEVRGGAPATRETDLLRPGMLVEHLNAVLLTGGSAFGLSAAHGVMRYLEERGVGFDAGVARVPIVPAAALFDLYFGDSDARPGPSEGYAACDAAAGSVPAAEEVAEGSVGAGTGATVAKLHGLHRAVKGGIGTASAERDGVIVGALFAVNAVGEIVDDDARTLAGALPGEDAPTPPPFGNTTIGVVATNAKLSKERAHLLAQASHEGLSRAIRPSHTIYDGDTVFALATGEIEAPQDLLETLAVQVVAEAIRRGVRPDETVPAPGETR